MKHLGLWIYAIAWGIVTGSFASMFLKPSQLGATLSLFGLLVALFGLMMIPPEDWEYVCWSK
jgi:FtsH-binding integral membrane protein